MVLPCYLVMLPFRSISSPKLLSLTHSSDNLSTTPHPTSASMIRFMRNGRQMYFVIDFTTLLYIYQHSLKPSSTEPPRNTSSFVRRKTGRHMLGSHNPMRVDLKFSRKRSFADGRIQLHACLSLCLYVCLCVCLSACLSSSVDNWSSTVYVRMIQRPHVGSTLEEYSNFPRALVYYTCT